MPALHVREENRAASEDLRGGLARKNARGLGNGCRRAVFEGREAHHGFTSARPSPRCMKLSASSSARPSPPSQGGLTRVTSPQGTSGKAPGPKERSGLLSPLRIAC